MMFTRNCLGEIPGTQTAGQIANLQLPILGWKFHETFLSEFRRSNGIFFGGGVEAILPVDITVNDSPYLHSALIDAGFFSFGKSIILNT